MTKFDHRLKRLEAKSGLKKHFNYWIITTGKGKESPAKAIQDIEAGLIIGKMGSRFNPESQNMIIVSAVPRTNDKTPRSHGSFPSKEIPDLTDDELEAEIRSVKKELEQCQS